MIDDPFDCAQDRFSIDYCFLCSDFRLLFSDFVHERRATSNELSVADYLSEVLAVMSKANNVLTTGEVAKICNVAPRTVSKWFDKGLLNGYRIPGSKDRRIPIDELVRFMHAHNIPWPKDYLGSAKRRKTKPQKAPKPDNTGNFVNS